MVYRRGYKHNSGRIKLVGTLLAIAALVAQPLLALDVPRVFAAGANVSSAVFEADDASVNINTNSDKFSVRLKNSGGSDEAVTGSATLHLTSSSTTGRFAPTTSDSYGATSEADFTISSGSSLISFYYKDSVAGTYTITATVGGGEIPTPVEVSTSVTVVDPTPDPAAPEVNAENFNTNNDSVYKGISVGFNAAHFGTVSEVKVDILRADGSHVIKYANQAVKDSISNKSVPVQQTAPFVIQEGTFTEASDVDNWQPAPASWTKDTKPVSVTISITDASGTKTTTNAAFNEGNNIWPTYLSLLPTPKVTVTSPVLGAFVTTAPRNTLTVSGTFTDDKAVNYLQLDLIYKGNLVTVYTMHYNNPGLAANGNFTVNIPVPAGLADGDYSLLYTGTDFDGGVTQRMERTFTIDNTAPAAPTDLLWTTASGHVLSIGNITNEVSGSASWTASTSSDVDHYLYKYWKAIDGNAFKQGSEYLEQIGGTSLWREFNQGEGVHYFCVVAVDRAGNQSPCSAPFVITYDATAPVITIATPTSGQVITTNTTDSVITISGTFTDNTAPNYAHIQLVDAIGASQGLTTVYGNADGTYSANLSTAGLPDGTYRVYVWGTDFAGNVSNREVTVQSFTLMRQAVQPAQPLANGPTTTSDNVQGASTTQSTSPQTALQSDASSSGTVLSSRTVGGFGGYTSGADSDTLATVVDESSKPSILGSSRVAQNTTSPISESTGDEAEATQCAQWFGVCWYWWVIGGVVTIVTLWIIAVITRRDDHATQ